MRTLYSILITTFLTFVLASAVLIAQSADFNRISLSDIQAASLSSVRINGSNNASNQIPTGTIVIYRTNVGRYGKLLIKEYGYNLKLRWTTYNTSGSVYSQGDNLVIRGTWSCDLDLGRETQTGRDFWWQQETSIERYLSPKNGAKFAIYLSSQEDSDNQFAGYVSDEEGRFVDYVWGFVDEFKNTWTKSQYYWGECRFLGSGHLSYADAVDLVYIAGHGSPSYIVMSSGEDCGLTSKAWGSFSSDNRRGDLEYIVFHSCNVLKMNSGWRSRWRHYYSTRNQKRPFSGLHLAMGFRTKHRNGAGAGWWAADEFAENLEDGYSVRYAWYEAAEDARFLILWYPNRNKPAVFYIRPHRYEKISGHNSLDYKYGDPEYLLDAYYMQ